MTNQSFLEREEVLKYIDTIDFKTQYIKITILDNTNTPLRAIEGRATGGSININGSSSVRRTGTLTLVTEYHENPSDPLEVMNAVSNMKTLISMNKRVKIELGIENNGPLYREYRLFWFTLGSYMIQNASVSYNIQQGIQISLKLMDKMALLNGEMGGTFAEEVVHSPLGLYADGTQTIVETGVKVRTLIEYLLRDYGELTTAEYRIEDIPNTVHNLLRWIYKEKALIVDTDKKELKLAQEESVEGLDIFSYHEHIGYTSTDFVYPLDKDLLSKAGETVVSVLDTIKNTLGNYEYFFDVNGVFHFREIKNQLNIGSAFDDLTKAIADKYFFKTLTEESVYSFKDARLVSSYANDPQYTKIKNDFVVWGKNNSKRDIRYHLRLQETPDSTKLSQWIVRFNTKPEHNAPYSIVEAQVKSAGMSWKGEEGVFLTVDDEDNSLFYIDFSAAQRPGRLASDGESVTDDEWRLLLYLQAIQKHLSRQTPFDKELMSYLPLLYSLEYPSVEYSPETKTYNPIPYDSAYIQENFFKPIYDRNNLSYWIDVINTNDAQLAQVADVQQFGVETIGKHTKVINDEKVNCLFSSVTSELDKYTFIESESEEVEFIEQDGKWTIRVPQNYVLEDNGKEVSFWTECVGLGTIEKPAFEVLRSSLHEYLSYNNNINIQVLPVYHLDANQRITVENKESDVYGDYVINTISLPLALNGMMTINARKAVERI